MKKCIIDMAIACIFVAVMGIALLYPEQIWGRMAVVLIAGILCAIFLFLAVWDDKVQMIIGSRHKHIISESDLVTEIILLNEEDKSIMTWSLYGKTAMVIGRDVKESQVNIDLGQSPYASMVEAEHAVLNYSAGNWYVEDLGSSNGIRVKKADDGRLYNLSPNTPCRLKRGDCLYIGLNRLLVL